MNPLQVNLAKTVRLHFKLDLFFIGSIILGTSF